MLSQPLDMPVPAHWRSAFEQFLRDLRTKDVAATLETTKAGALGGAHRPHSIVFRIEDATCVEDRCLTIIGRIIDGKFISDVMFLAGKHVSRGDAMVPLFGFQTVPLWFEGSKSSVTLLETPKGWIVAPK
jgi:hypothetical protein